ncbi:hypothetical protein [Hydrogenophaga sp. RWCD_12]|uniref:hypothetical protein n=1 Tax=Hydrogenophaga sp. RWCD_12 TaxID=3391190 RepID=UPI00398537EE
MKRRLSRILIAATLTICSATSFAQGLATFEELRKVTDAAMQLAGKGETDAALKSFRHLTVIPKAEFDSMLAQSAAFLPTVAARFGNPIGQEFIEEKWVGKSMVRLTYFQKYDNQAMPWVFFCYLGKSGWVINTFRFDDKPQNLF